MGTSFVHETAAQRVGFGTGDAAARIQEEALRLDLRRVMLVSSGRDPNRAERLSAGVPVALRFERVRQHVPVLLAEQARDAASSARVDGILSIGGGSAVGLAKAVALTMRLPIIAVPTTYAGSEATSTWGMTDGGVKTTGRDARVLPRAVVYDTDLVASLPPALAAASGMNALAHAVDALWAPASDPIDRALALEGARALGTALPQAVADAHDAQACGRAQYGAYVCAVAFASSGSGLHHKICHVLGGMFGLPHAATHAVLLPHVLALNAPAVPDLAARLAAALDASDVHIGDDPAQAAVDAVAALASAVHAPSRLADLGFTTADIPRAVPAILAAAPASNPVRVDEAAVITVLRHAVNGERPVVTRPVGDAVERGAA